MKTALCLLASLTFAAAESVTLSPSQDGDIYSYLDQPTTTIHTLNVSASGEGAPHSNRSLIQFDFSTLGIPADQIGSAVLKLYTYPPDIGATGFGNVSIRRQASAWSATTLRWNQIQPQEQVSLLPVNAMNVWVEADVTSMVKQWKAGTVANHGFVLMPESETSPLNVTFLAMDLPNPAYTPRLVITRAEPAPVLAIGVSSGQIVLEWPVAGSSGWTLQESASLAGPWSASTASTTSSGGRWKVQQVPGNRRFFRLFKP